MCPHALGLFRSAVKSFGALRLELVWHIADDEHVSCALRLKVYDAESFASHQRTTIAQNASTAPSIPHWPVLLSPEPPLGRNGMTGVYSENAVEHGT